MKPVSVLTSVLMTVVGGTLDAYTYLSHGVFATAQTGNAVLLFVGIVRGEDPWQYLLPIIAFVLAVAAVQPVKHLTDAHRARTCSALVLGFELVLLFAIGFIPAGAASEWITIPLSVLAGLQLGLFRAVANVSFASIATTGNLMRLAEAGYGALRERTGESRRTLLLCAAIVAGFCVGAAIGAGATFALHSRAIWFSAAIQCATLVLFLVESSAPARPGPGDSGS